jgi:hypothetical protein
MDRVIKRLLLEDVVTVVSSRCVSDNGLCWTLVVSRCVVLGA